MESTFSLDDIDRELDRVERGEINWDGKPLGGSDLDVLGDNYVIAWTSNLTGKQGCGTKAMPHSVVLAIAADADRRSRRSATTCCQGWQ